MCNECREEYENPNDRRFHAQPNACPNCGPHIELWDKNGTLLFKYHDAILRTAEAIRSGKIVGLKGVGGFQLLVDARNEESVKLLRMRKHREEKPFALMYPSLEDMKNDCEVSEMEERLLLSPESPIVLLKRNSTLQRFRDENNPDHLGSRTFAGLAPSIAPRNPYLGAMLPYTPLHYILMRELVFPVVATSGNISDEPICIDEYEALKKLSEIVDFFLVHDRSIERHVDDSVVRIMMDRIQVVRLARGYAPFPIELNSGLRTPYSGPILAVGGHLKNTIAINSGNNIFISQHIGDLSTQGSFNAFEKVTRDFQKLYDISPSKVVHDLHPDYLPTQVARKFQIEKVSVQHHFAHVASCMVDNKLSGEVLGVSWDGTGYGDDGTVWGGEFLKIDGASYQRVATLRSFRLPGGSVAVKEPRRTAVGLLHELFGEKLFSLNVEPIKAFDYETLTVLRKMLQTGLNSPITTSAGRLFDAVSSIVGLRQVVNFEGQGAMELEFALDGIDSNQVYNYRIIETEALDSGCKIQDTRSKKDHDPSYIVDWEQMIKEILFDKSIDVPTGLISAKYHNTLAAIIVHVAEKIGSEKVVLSGGCFQNKYLTERTIARLTEEGFKPYWHQRVPPNDGGISLGQLFIALNAGRKQEERNPRQEVTRKKLIT